MAGPTASPSEAEIASDNVPHRHARKLGGERRRQPIVVRPQLHEDLIQPRLPIIPRRDRGIDPGHPEEPSNRDGMRFSNRSFRAGAPKCMTAQRRAGMLKLLVAEVMVMVRAAISGWSAASGIQGSRVRK